MNYRFFSENCLAAWGSHRPSYAGVPSAKRPARSVPQSSSLRGEKPGGPARLASWGRSPRRAIPASLWLVLAAVAAVVLVLAMSRSNYYIVAEHEGRTLFAWAISKGERFEVEFVHSLNLSPVIDIFEFTGDGLVLRKSIFSSLGAGAPTPSDFPGSELIHADGVFKLVGIDRPMGAFAVLTSEVPNHRVSFGCREALLLELAGPGESVTIEVRRIGLLSRIRAGLTETSG